MPRVILLLPAPDRLQLANCHKYVTRTGPNKYDEIYTFSTVAGRCATAEKILIIGHGNKGGLHNSTINQAADAIISSGLPLTGGSKVAFDTCYAATNTAWGSAMGKVGSRIKALKPGSMLKLTGAYGCTITIGGDKRMVVNPDPAKEGEAGGYQDFLKDKIYKVDLGSVRPDWDENASSARIKLWAEEEYNNLAVFAGDFRTIIAQEGLLLDGAVRKHSFQI